MLVIFGCVVALVVIVSLSFAFLMPSAPPSSARHTEVERMSASVKKNENWAVHSNAYINQVYETWNQCMSACGPAPDPVNNSNGFNNFLNCQRKCTDTEDNALRN